MKKIFILVYVFLGIQVQYFSQITWDGGGADNNWSTAANWAGDNVPITTDNIIFDGTSTKNCDFDIDITVASFSVLSGYTGTINMGAGDHNMHNLVINSGTVIGSSSSLNLDANNTFSLGASGTFSNNGGTFAITMAASDVFTFAGNISLFDFGLSLGSNGSERTVNFGTNLKVENFIVVAGTGSKPIGFTGTIHINGSMDISAGNSTSIPVTNSGTFIIDGSAVTVTGAGAVSEFPLPNVQINTTGNYAVTGHLNVRGSWAGTQGTLTVASSTVNFFSSSATITGTASAFDNLVIRSGASLTFPASAEVLVAKTFSNGGSVTFPATTTLGLNGGTSAQSISGTGFTIGGIHAYSGGRTITLSSAVSVLDFLDIDANVTFAAGTNLTLKSTNALTARLGQLGSGASISGNVTVETVIPGGATGWAVLGVRGVNGQTVANWDTYTSSGGTNGIPMTCVGCVNDPSSIPTGWFKSVQGWDETDALGTGGYDTTVSSSTALTPGVGFWVYVGDAFATSNDLKLVNTGTLKTGNVNVAVTAGGAQSGFNLVANPYPSPILWSSVMADFNNASTVNDAIYAFSADNGQTSYVGGGASHGAPSGIDNIIPGGQGFYVEATAGGTLDFDESMKSTSNTSANPLVKAAATASVGQTFRLKLQGANDWGATLFRIHGNATPAFDKKLDAKQFFNSPGYVGYPGAYSKYTTISSKDNSGLDYSIQSLPPLSNNVSVPILARVSTSGTYTISAYDFKDFPMCVGLVDKLNNSYHDLRLSPYVVTINDTTSAPRFELLLCRDEAVNPTGINEVANTSNILISQDAQGAYVKTVFEKNTKAVISVYNIIGQKLLEDISVEGAVTNTPLPIDLHNQVVIIKVTTDKESVTKKVVLH